MDTLSVHTLAVPGKNQKTGWKKKDKSTMRKEKCLQHLYDGITLVGLALLVLALYHIYWAIRGRALSTFPEQWEED